MTSPTDESRALKRIQARGRPLTEPYPCEWRSRPALVALTTTGISLASESRSLQYVPSAPVLETILEGAGTQRVLTMRRIAYHLGFGDSGTADGFERALHLYRERAQSVSNERGVRRPAGDEHILPRCTYLGGAYLPLAAGSDYDILVSPTALQIFEHPAMQASTYVCSLSVDSRLSVNLGGPGLVTHGGGWAGAGYGITGALEGAAIAQMLNKLTTRQSVTTVITIANDDVEGFFVNRDTTPEQLRRSWSVLYVHLRKSASGSADLIRQTVATSTPADDFLSRLERLNTLHRAGGLTDKEYDIAKAAVLRGL